MYEKFKRQSKLWRYAAWTAPFVALAALIGTEYIVLNDYKGYVSLAVVIVFISTSVFWWWWVMDKLNDLVRLILSSEEKFLEVKDYIKETKEIMDGHERDRKRGE